MLMRKKMEAASVSHLRLPHPCTHVGQGTHPWAHMISEFRHPKPWTVGISSWLDPRTCSPDLHVGRCGLGFAESSSTVGITGESAPRKTSTVQVRMDRVAYRKQGTVKLRIDPSVCAEETMSPWG